MLKKFAKTLSLIFHPLWIPTYLFAIIFGFSPSLALPIQQEIMPRMLLTIFLLTGVIPLLTLVVMRLPYFIMIVRLWARQLSNNGGYSRALMEIRPQIEMVRKRSVINSFNLTNRTERVIPFFVITAFYLAVCVMLSGRLGWGNFFIVAMIVIAATSLMVSLVTLFWKISVHSVAVCSVVGFLLSAMVVRAESALLNPLVGWIIISGAVMSARLYLNVHTSSQVWWGCFTGFIISFFTSWWYL